MDDLEVAKSDNFTLFNPAFIDDYGFTPEEFRVFARIMRRSLGENSKGCYESIPHMAEALKISEALIRRSLNVLATCRAISRTIRQGMTDLMVFNPCEKWKPASDLESIRKIYTPYKNVTTIENVSGIENVTTTGYENARGVVTKTQGKGIPIKDIPIRNTDPTENSVVLSAPPKPKKTLLPFPDDFAISQAMRDWARFKVPNVDIDDELEEFCDYWREISTKNEKRTAKGWIATWQGRMRLMEKAIPVYKKRAPLQKFIH